MSEHVNEFLRVSAAYLGVRLPETEARTLTVVDRNSRELDGRS